MVAARHQLEFQWIGNETNLIRTLPFCCVHIDVCIVKATNPLWMHSYRSIITKTTVKGLCKLRTVQGLIFFLFSFYFFLLAFSLSFSFVLLFQIKTIWFVIARLIVLNYEVVTCTHNARRLNIDVDQWCNRIFFLSSRLLLFY